MWVDVGSVMGAEAAVSVMMAKTKLGGLVRRQRVEATGVDLTPTLCRVDRGRVWMPSCFMSKGESSSRLYVCVYVRSLRVFSKLAAPPGDNPWDTSNQPQCMCDTCFFIQSSCLFIFRHHQNASCYFLPSSGQTNNRCEGLERNPPLHLSPSPPPVLWLVCDNLCTLFPSFPLFCFPAACPSLVRYVGDIKLHPSPTRSHWMTLASHSETSFVSVCVTWIILVYVSGSPLRPPSTQWIRDLSNLREWQVSTDTRITVSYSCVHISMRHIINFSGTQKVNSNRKCCGK